MNHQEGKIKTEFHEDEIDLKKIFLSFWKRRLLIVSITSSVAILSVLYSLSLPNIYSSQALLAPATAEDSLTSKLSGFSALGTIAGFPLSSNTATKSQEAIERIRSFEFFSNHFLPYVKLENIMATKEWIPEENKLIYDEKIFNKSNNKWVRNKPTLQRAFKRYKSTISISENKRTSFITISVQHKSPIIAKEWLDIIIYQINESMRKIDAETAENSIAYLNRTTQSTNVQSIKEAISKLLENQMQVLMLTASSEYYVLKIIDSPIVPEEKISPSRALICIVGTMLGGFLSLLVALIQNYREPSIKLSHK